MTAGVGIERAGAVTDELVAGIAGLVPQLSSSAPAPGRAELEELVASPSTALFVARQHDGEQGAARSPVVGMLTLVSYRVPTGVHAVIEDVVVDGARQGAGIGAALVRAALEEAAARGSHHVDLTSRPGREAANRLYQRVGFSKRQTNVYRYTLT